MSVQITESDRLTADAMFSASALKRLVVTTVVDHFPLIDAFCIATALHVLLLPVIWCLGWGLPWPKSPVITSVIEIDLQDWPNMAKSKKLYEFRDPKLNE